MTVAKAIARAWIDPKYKTKLMHDPHTALADVGVSVTDGAKVNVVENTDGVVHLVIPIAPDCAVELSPEVLEKIAGSGPFIAEPGSTW